MPQFDIDTPESGSIKIRLPGPGVEFTRFLAYRYKQDFLNPSDTIAFDLSHDELAPADQNALAEASEVEVYIDDRLQVSGYIDDIDIVGEEGSGTIVHVSG